MPLQIIGGGQGFSCNNPEEIDFSQYNPEVRSNSHIRHRLQTPCHTISRRGRATSTNTRKKPNTHNKSNTRKKERASYRPHGDLTIPEREVLEEMLKLDSLTDEDKLIIRGALINSVGPRIRARDMLEHKNSGWKSKSIRLPQPPSKSIARGTKKRHSKHKKRHSKHKKRTLKKSKKR